MIIQRGGFFYNPDELHNTTRVFDEDMNNNSSGYIGSAIQGQNTQGRYQSYHYSVHRNALYATYERHDSYNPRSLRYFAPKQTLNPNSLEYINKLLFNNNLQQLQHNDAAFILKGKLNDGAFLLHVKLFVQPGTRVHVIRHDPLSNGIYTHSFELQTGRSSVDVSKFTQNVHVPSFTYIFVIRACGYFACNNTTRTSDKPFIIARDIRDYYGHPTYSKSRPILVNDHEHTDYNNQTRRMNTMSNIPGSRLYKEYPSFSIAW